MLYFHLLKIFSFKIKAINGKYVYLEKGKASVVEGADNDTTFENTPGDNGKVYFTGIDTGLSMDVKLGWGTQLLGWPTEKHYNLEFTVKPVGGNTELNEIIWMKGNEKLCWSVEDKTLLMKPCGNNYTQLFKFDKTSEEDKSSVSDLKKAITKV